MNKGYYLSIFMGSVKTEPVPKAVIEALTEVQVTTAASSQSGFQLKFTLGRGSLIDRTLLPSGYFDPQRRVIIVVTIKGTPHVIMDGIITKQDVSPSNEAGQSMLTITGSDLSVLMDFVDLSDIPYPAIPPSIVVTLILAKYAVFGVVPVAVPSVIGLIENPLDKIPKQKGTDLNYINLLAKKVGHVFYIDPGPAKGMSIAYWGPEIRFGQPQPALNVDMAAATNVESLSFSYNGMARKQLLVTILPKELKVPIPIPVPDIGLLKPTLAQKKAVTLKTERMAASKLTPAKAALFALGATASSADAVTGSGQLDVLRYGRVLKARQLVAVRGASVTYDGLYFVNSVTHNIKHGEYKQSFSLVRGGVTSSISRVDT